MTRYISHQSGRICGLFWPASAPWISGWVSFPVATATAGFQSADFWSFGALMQPQRSRFSSLLCALHTSFVPAFKLTFFFFTASLLTPSYFFLVTPCREKGWLAGTQVGQLASPGADLHSCHGEVSAPEPSPVAPRPDWLVPEQLPVSLPADSRPSLDSRLPRSGTATTAPRAGLRASPSARALAAASSTALSPGQGARPPPASTRRWRTGFNTREQTFGKVKQGQRNNFSTTKTHSRSLKKKKKIRRGGPEGL